MSSKLEPAMWSLDTGQRNPCFDRCQLTIYTMDVQYRICTLLTKAAYPTSCSMAVERARPRAKPLATFTMTKAIYGFL